MPFPADQVPLFLAVLDCGSFSAAARQLGRVPSAVSMAIAQLEAELDLQLFDRSGREPRPTPAARALEPQARLLAAQVDALKELHSGRAHLALVFERPAIDGREDFQEMGQETMVAVMAARHPLAHGLGAGGRQLLDVGELAGTRQILLASRDLAHTDPRFVFSHQLWRTDSHQAALSLISAGLGWGWLPFSVAEPLLQAGTLLRIPLCNISNGTQLFVDWVWSKERPLGLAARRFVAQLQLPARLAPG
jgi:DNA-binding transcriptional LysR family regulator